MSNSQPGKSGASNVPEHSTRISTSHLHSDDDEDDFEDLFMDSDSDEDMFLAKQLSLLMMNSEDCTVAGFSEADYADEQEDEVTQQSVCEICTDESEDMLSYGCTHYYCRNCVKTTLEIAINDGHTDTFKCPDTKCDVSASENFVKTVISTTVFDRYEKFMLKKAVGDMDDIMYCPLEGCGALIETDGSGSAECYKCFHLLCTLCSKFYHGNTDCDLTEEERTENFRRIRDEEVAEKILLQESQDELIIEELERDNKEWLRMIRDEQAEVRRMEQLEQEEEERKMEEERQRAEKARQLEDQRRREEEFQRLVQENEERERRQKQKQDERRQAELASENTVLRTTKKCPECKAPIEKNDGCIHMTCIRCTYEFCWKCMHIWSHDHICPTNK